MEKEKLHELYVVSPKVRPYFSTQATKKMSGPLFNLLLKYGPLALLILGLIGVKLGYIILTLYLVGFSPLTGSDNYPMIIGGMMLVLLIFGGAFIGITLRKIIGVVICLLGVIIDIIVRVITINELVGVRFEFVDFSDFQLLIKWLMFDLFDFFFISLFLVSAIFTIRVFRLNNKKKLRQTKLCKNCGKFIVDPTPGFCPHCGHLISS
ncbi:MAG: hypothetical protein ACFFC7_26090 [Candidatus Hermodarchaeota archaeon]